MNILYLELHYCQGVWEDACKQCHYASVGLYISRMKYRKETLYMRYEDVILTVVYVHIQKNKKTQINMRLGLLQMLELLKGE